MRSPRVRLDDLAAFVTFADCLNLSEAARRLHISQPALHTKFRLLADRLGTSLYQRRGKVLVLTADGEVVARFARESEDRARMLQDLLRGRAAQQPVTLAAGTGVFSYLLGPAIEGYLRKAIAPLRLRTADGVSGLQLLIEGRCQLAVAPAAAAWPTGVTSELLARVGQVLIVPVGHRLARRRKLALEDLDGSALIVPPAGQPHRETLARLSRAAGVSWEVAVEANGWDLMMRFVQMGIGLAVVNDYCKPPRGTVAVALPALPAIDLHLIRWQSAPASAEGERLRHLLLSATEAWRPSRAGAQSVGTSASKSR